MLKVLFVVFISLAPAGVLAKNIHVCVDDN